MDEYRVLIGVCSGGTIRAETATSIVGAMDVLKQNGVSVNLLIQIGGYAPHNRNKLVQSAQERNMTHLMFVDNDMKFLPSGIQRLLDADKDIIGVNYNTRGLPGKKSISTIKLLDEKGNLQTDGRTQDFEVGAPIFKLGGLGTGFMLIKMSVFDKLPKPYFTAYEEASGEHHTEDIDFCIRASQRGYDIWCNPTIKVLHVGTYEY